MGIHVLAGKYDGGDDERACMVDGTTGTAFGPLFRPGQIADAADLANDFVTRYAGLGHPDLRTLTDADLLAAVEEWKKDLCPACETTTCACTECQVRCGAKPAHLPTCSEAEGA